MAPERLPEDWRQRAKELRRLALEPTARAFEECADALEEALARLDDELLDLQQAAAESGYSADHLGRLLREKRLENAGRPNAPLVRRADLPMKAGIHPEYLDATISCACGHVLQTRSIKGSYSIEICSACHPFFTGKQKLVDTEGRVERLRKRMAKAKQAQAGRG